MRDDLCTGCLECLEVCPVGAIDPADQPVMGGTA